MRPKRDLFRPPRGRAAHGTDGVLVLPGGAVGFRPCVVVVVAVGVGAAVGAVVPVGTVVGPPVGAVVGAVDGAVVGTTVGGGAIVVPMIVGGTDTGAVVLLLDGEVDESSPGVLDCPDGRSPGVFVPSPGVCVGAAASTAGCVGRCFALAGSGSGISGVSMLGPPRRLLAMSTR